MKKYNSNQRRSAPRMIAPVFENLESRLFMSSTPGGSAVSLGVTHITPIQKLPFHVVTLFDAGGWKATTVLPISGAPDISIIETPKNPGTIAITGEIQTGQGKFKRDRSNYGFLLLFLAATLGDFTGLPRGRSGPSPGRFSIRLVHSGPPNGRLCVMACKTACSSSAVCGRLIHWTQSWRLPASGSAVRSIRGILTDGSKKGWQKGS